MISIKTKNNSWWLVAMKPMELEECEYEYCMRCSSADEDDEGDADFILRKRYSFSQPVHF